MLIEFDKYQPNSLKKGRIQAFEQDISDAYSIFCSRLTEPRLITINDFHAFWTYSQLKFIVYCRGEEQDEDEYFHVLDKILINDYFMKQNQSKKIYALFCLYYLHYAVDANGDRNVRYIYVNVEFINQLNVFMQQNAAFSKHLFMKIIKKIEELFMYTIKIGARNPLIKKNGDTYVRYPKPFKKLTKDNYSPAIFEVKEEMPKLEQSIKSYQEEKDKFFKKYKNETDLAMKKQMGFDKNITLRLNQIIRSYDSEVSYVEDNLKYFPDLNIDE